MSIDRRSMLGAGAGLVASTFLWSCVRRGEQSTLPPAQMALLTKVCDLVIPRTDTPGAIDAGVPMFVALALKHGLEGTGNQAAAGAPPCNDYGRWLAANLAPDPAKSLPDIDATAFAKGAAPSPWKRLKGLILTGFFTSEVGASKVLRYELMPGRFDPDLPIKPGDTSWASDWTAVEFG